MRHPTGGQTATDWKNVRLLVFGLDDQFRFLARQTFRKLMVRDVTPFSDPAETAGLMGRGVDLVLLDLAASPEKGLAVLEALRRPAGNPFEAVPVLVVAPSSQKDDIDRAKALGIEGTLPKPISGHELSHRVADTLANPQRLAAPATVVAKPKLNAIKDPDPLPEMAGEDKPAPVVTGFAPPPPAPAKEAIPEVAALAARLAARGAPAAPSAAPAPRPASPVPAAPAPRPAPTAPGDGYSGGGAGPASGRRPSGGSFDMDDAPAVAKRPSGGKLDLDDLAPAPVKLAGGKLGDGDLAVRKPDPDEEARRRAAERRRQQWQEAMEQSGHKARKGGDVAALDLTAVVAEHGTWLQSKGAEGKRATFSGMDLAGADLTGALLPNATFKDVDLSDASLSDARLDGSDFRYAKLEAADLGGANLGVAALRHAKLRLSNLEGAVLRGTDLSGATLTGARMAGADFKGAVLIGADLREADLSKAEGLTQGQVEKTICDLATRLPPGLSRPAKPE
ncbi:hypothetical protein A6A04_17570 [Paramagnetospirillum marisnigri]|uniref:Response regulatory domain-containing protein n=1 Tax=Paramagnetospirillum marisnigri TaxID=1285242 RepID=A0A178MPW5_9PROT|nr:pentapeptide repeat-containing protein [Paramagnetospirillum marisnigri]OAN50641.1 hypothetical protein A6A04_17570 [Paramagnetospirillum marisnigri]